MASNGRQRSEPGRREARRRSPDRRNAIIAILLMAAAVLMFIALVSYDPSDEANADVHLTDLFKVFTGDPGARAKADTAHNWLGLVGAILSDFLVKSTIGYAVYCIPVLVMFWGWITLRKGDVRQGVTITNYTLVGALLVSAAFGMLRLILVGSAPRNGMERGCGGLRCFHSGPAAGAGGRSGSAPGRHTDHGCARGRSGHPSDLRPCPKALARRP